MELLPLMKHGWKLENDILTFDWGSEENIQNVNKRVAGLLKGCCCKTGFKTARRGCKKGYVNSLEWNDGMERWS